MKVFQYMTMNRQVSLGLVVSLVSVIKFAERSAVPAMARSSRYLLFLASLHAHAHLPFLWRPGHVAGCVSKAKYPGAFDSVQKDKVVNPCFIICIIGSWLSGAGFLNTLLCCMHVDHMK